MLQIVKKEFTLCVHKYDKVYEGLMYESTCLKEYYEIVGESRPLSVFFPTHADLFTEMHFYSWN